MSRCIKDLIKNLNLVIGCPVGCDYCYARNNCRRFEPLFDDPGEVDLSGIDWIVIGTMTGAMKRKVHTEPSWAYSLTGQAHAKGIPVFMKEDLVPILGEENMVQELPDAFNRVLEAQRHVNS